MAPVQLALLPGLDGRAALTQGAALRHVDVLHPAPHLADVPLEAAHQAGDPLQLLGHRHEGGRRPH
eukprot:1760296-Lingulodinium_polyedra.AAC.1